jgi:hypothetical protein
MQEFLYNIWQVFTQPGKLHADLGTLFFEGLHHEKLL